MLFEPCRVVWTIHVSKLLLYTQHNIVIIVKNIIDERVCSVSTCVRACVYRIVRYTYNGDEIVRDRKIRKLSDRF